MSHYSDRRRVAWLRRPLEERPYCPHTIAARNGGNAVAELGGGREGRDARGERFYLLPSVDLIRRHQVYCIDFIFWSK